MALLPKPYPDEVIGSVIARAAWHNGLPLKVLLKDVFGPQRSCSSFLMSSELQRLELLAGTDAEEILMCHTVFPYATAFMTDSVRAGLKSKALNPKKGEDCLGSITKNVSHGVPYRRVCPSCIKEDLATYGESYWRREHLLPGALVCTRHGTKLRLTNVALRGRAQARDTLLPHLLAHFRSKTKLTLGQLQIISEFSIKALNWKTAPAEELLGIYRSKAAELGYQLPKGDFGSVELSRAVLRFFGSQFLEDSGATMTKHTPWSSLMLRPGVGIPFAASKHVLLLSFFQQAVKAPLDVSASYRPPGKKPSDFKRLDSRLTQRLTNLVKKAVLKNIRLTVKKLLRDAGSWSIFRHQRHLFPKTTEFIQNFRNSEQAERQVGCRAY